MPLFIMKFSFVVSYPGTDQQDTSLFGVVESKYMGSAKNIQ